MGSHKLSIFAGCASIALLSLFMGVRPAGACCQFAGSCSGSLTRSTCTSQGGSWVGCATCSQGICSAAAITSAPSTATPDVTPPTCRMTGFREGPPAQIEITVQDTESGLGQILVLDAENVFITVPSFVEGTTDPVVVTATKDDQSLLARVLLGAGDLDENCTSCDPILTSIVRGRGRENKEQSFANVDAVDHIVTVNNGTPGLTSLEVQVNGTSFRLSRLEDGETRTLDVSSAMLPGAHNAFTLRSHGKLGSSALIVIWDGLGLEPDSLVNGIE
jgi:hypothetical protein